MTTWVVWAACRKDTVDLHSAPVDDSELHTATPTLPCVPEALASGALDEDCNGTARDTVPLARARSLEVRGDHSSELGTSVACSATQVGTFPTAFSAGAWELADKFGDGGWAILVDPSRTGSISIETADVVVRGDPRENDALGTRVVFPGDVDGDGRGEWLVTALKSYRPDALTGAAFLFDAAEPGWFTPEDARVHFRGESVQAMLGGATAAGDLDGDGLAEVVLAHTFMNVFDEPGFVAVHRGGDLRGTVFADEAAARIDAVDPFQATGFSAQVGDLTGDGVADLIAPEPNWKDPFSEGRVLVLPGPLLGATPRSLDAASIVVTGPPQSTGRQIALGDLNQDGLPDLVVGSLEYESAAGARTGAVYVFFGPMAPGTRDTTAADVTVYGEAAYAFFSFGLAVVDHDGDGAQDLVVAASQVRNGPTKPGLVYVFAGPLSAGTLDATDAAVVYEDDQHLAGLGYAVDGCDLDGDGDDEIVVGAPFAGWDGLPAAGRVQVVPGGPWQSPTR